MDDDTSSDNQVITTPNISPENISNPPSEQSSAEPSSEPLVIPPKEEGKHTPPPPPKLVPKKKGGKGMLIGILLFFILTLPVAIYYGTQQIADIRSRAGITTTYQCVATTTACVTVLHGEVVPKTSSNACTTCTTTCCKKTVGTTKTPTRSVTRTPTPGGCRNPGDYPTHCVGGCPSGQQCVVESSYTCHCISATNTPTRAATRTPTKTPTRPATSPTPCNTKRGCIGGTLITVNKPGFSCQVCSHGGIMTCDGPQGGSGGDPCQVQRCDGSVVSTSCQEANMIRCNCGGNAWVGGRPGVTCAQLCACAGISCDQCTPTPPHTTNPPEVTDTPTPTTVITNTPTTTTTPTITTTITPTISTTNPPGTCDASCDTDENCESGLLCYSVTGVKRCRKETCPNESTCECPVNTPTPTTRYYVQNTPTERVIVYRTIVVTATQQPTPKIPVSGIIDVKVVVITIGSILLLALGLIL